MRYPWSVLRGPKSIAHGGQDLIREPVIAPRTEALIYYPQLHVCILTLRNPASILDWPHRQLRERRPHRFAGPAPPRPGAPASRLAVSTISQKSHPSWKASLKRSARVMPIRMGSAPSKEPDPQTFASGRRGLARLRPAKAQIPTPNCRSRSLEHLARTCVSARFPPGGDVGCFSVLAWLLCPDADTSYRQRRCSRKRVLTSTNWPLGLS